MKKIMHITYDMRIGGTEMVIKNIIENNDPKRFSMSVFCIEEPLGPWGKQLRDNGLEISSQMRNPGFDLSLIKRLRRQIKQQHIDIVHCHQYTPWVYGALAALGTRAKVVFTEHGRFYPDSSSWKRRIVNPLLSLITHRITAISKATKQALVTYEFLADKEISVIYNGISPLSSDSSNAARVKQELNIPENHVVLGTIARFDPIKNQRMMLSAFASILKSFPQTTLLMIGDGEERAALEQQVESLNISDHVIFAGYVTAPVHHLAAMDIFLLSSLSEGTSMTLLEAMSLGKPCIVTDAGGNAEVIKHNVNGIVVENNNTSAFAHAIEQIMKQSDSKMQVAAVSRFQQRFSVDNMSQKYNQLYSQLSGQMRS